MKKKLFEKYGLERCKDDSIKGGVIMNVTSVDQARIAENAGASAVIAIERVSADTRDKCEINRMSDPALIKEIKNSISIPVISKVRIGHFVEAQVLETIGIDYIDESEVLTPVDYRLHIDKWGFDVPFVCGANNLAEALRRISEGANMIRIKGEVGTGDISSVVEHKRRINFEIDRLSVMKEEDLMDYSRDIFASYDLIKYVRKHKRLPVLNFAAGGIATPTDAAMMMQLGCDGVFIGSGIFKSTCPEKRAEAIVNAVKYYNDRDKIAEISEKLGDPMSGICISGIPTKNRLAIKEW